MTTSQAIQTKHSLAVAINTEHQAALAAAKSAIEHARKCGELLLQAKEQVDHGAWLPWLKENAEFSERTAQNYMRIATGWQELESKTQRVADLPVREAVKLLSTTTSEDKESTPFVPPREGAPKPPIDWTKVKREWDEMLAGQTKEIDGFLAAHPDLAEEFNKHAHLAPPMDQHGSYFASFNEGMAQVCESPDHRGYWHADVYLYRDSVVEGTSKPIRPEAVGLVLCEAGMFRPVKWTFSKSSERLFPLHTGVRGSTPRASSH